MGDKEEKDLPTSLNDEVSKDSTSQKKLQQKDIDNQTPHQNVPEMLSSNNLSAYGLSASPPSFISIEQMLKAAADVSKSEFNMTLAHEIAVNKDFQLQMNLPEDSFKSKVKNVLHKAFWDILHEKLNSDPPDYSQAMLLLTEVKEGLLQCLSPHHLRIRNEINEILDIDLIRQQAEQNALDVLGYAKFIISTMSRICAPVRDSDIEELQKLTEIVPLYRGILETLDLMKLDMANFTILQLRPYIQQHSIEYERKKFQEILNSLESLTPPIDGLKFTRKWLAKTFTEIPCNSNDKPSDGLVLRKAYIKILQWEETEEFPETLHLDHARFLNLRDNLKALILTASVLLVTYSNMGPAIQGISDFKVTLKNHVQILLEDAPLCSPEELKIKMETTGLQVIDDLNKCLEEHGYPLLTKEKADILLSQICKIAEPDHNVRQLIKRRVLEFLEEVLNTSSTLKIPSGLSALQTQLSGFAGQFLTLVKHNQEVFSEIYGNILTQCKRDY